MKNSRGVTLIMVAAVLAILAAMATGFYTLMLMQTKSAVRYADTIRADMVAKAGIQFGIAQLRAQAFKKTEDASTPWYQVDYMRGATKRISFPDSPLRHDNIDNDVPPDGEADNLEEALLDPSQMQGYSGALGSSAGPDSDRFVLNITDAAGKININAGDNLAVMLDNLCRVIGPPLVAAKLDAIQPRRWAVEADAGDPMVPLYSNAFNANDTAANRDIYYAFTNEAGTVMTDGTGRPKRGADGIAIYGDGYAIAGYRGRYGAYRNLEDIKAALTYVERNGTSAADDPLEQLEIEVKFAAIRDHITTSSWVDTNTVCVGKFEWIKVDSASNKTYAIDRDKSWVIDDPVGDPLNNRGSLRGCYLSIMNGHGAGQLRRIRTNGIDWIEVEPPTTTAPAFSVSPGPTSSYMIVANEEALLTEVDGTATPQYSYQDKLPPIGKKLLPKTNANGTLVRDPRMDYVLHPLCIHRAPVNVNTATDKVLIAQLLGINVQHGHPLALGTDVDVLDLRTKWKWDDPHKVEPYLLTPGGMKRIPAASGKVILNRSWGTNKNQVPLPPIAAAYDVAYLNNYNSLGPPNFLKAQATDTMNEAHELAYRIIMARQSDRLQPTLKFIDPKTGGPTATDTGLLRGPFRTYDDLYFRAIKPWDEARFTNGWEDQNSDNIKDDGDKYHAAKLSSMLMANFNSNTDILKFNPNIEWIDRWSRNFTALEPVMIYTNDQALGSTATVDVGPAVPFGAQSVPIYTAVQDPQAKGWDGGLAPPIKSGQKDAAGQFILGAYITRNFRYKSNEMIDKTDLNRSTTEFSFDSNGIFEIVSTGQVVNRGDVLAERKFMALVKVYDVWRESTQQQFVQGTISKAYGDRNDPTKFSCIGQLARDASGRVERKGLVTQPEPLLPLQARIQDDYPNGKLASAKTVPNQELVSSLGGGSSDPLDAFGNPRKNPYDATVAAIDVPEVLANRILPARYDGQIALATNTSVYDPKTNGDADSFLVSFDGDLDTATCEGNGREQAKWPCSAENDGSGGFRYTGKGNKIRCVQGIGLLGLLNDTYIASDPGLPLADAAGNTPYNNFAAQKDSVRWVYPLFGIGAALMPLPMGADIERPDYWYNVTLRMGSLRTDGAYLSAPGVAGNNATLKYDFTERGGKKLNYQPDSADGNCVSMWAKPAWHYDDMRNHEFFNPGNVSRTGQCGGFWFQKMGQYKWCSSDLKTSLGHCGNRRELNDLFSMMMYQNGSGYGSAIHGGSAGVDAQASPDEDPGYRVQPFRWSYLGFRANYRTTAPQPPGGANTYPPIGPRGHLASSDDWSNPNFRLIVRHYVRPFIDTALFPESRDNYDTNDYAYRLRWSYQAWLYWNTNREYQVQNKAWPYNNVGDQGDVTIASSFRYGRGQDAKWKWADPYGTPTTEKIFGLNNLNYGNPTYNDKFNQNNGVGACALLWHYREMPEDGTYAVIDELKISNKDRVMVDGASDWDNDRITREMQLSRYYLPPFPGTRFDPSAGGPPTFTSQTLLQSLKGFDKIKDEQKIAVVRVSWNVFTPRFMCEYKTPEVSLFPTRKEKLTHFASTNATQTEVSTIKFKGPFDYKVYNDYAMDSLDVSDTKYKEVLYASMRGYYSVNRPPPWEYKTVPAQSGRGVEVELLETQGGTVKILDNKTFTDPSAVNSLATPDTPVWTTPSQFRYRVRFCYPVDPLVDPYVLTRDRNGKPCVDPRLQYLLDTPVFDDISITYILSPRIVEFREMVE